MSWKAEQTAVANGCKYRIKAKNTFLSRQQMLELMVSTNEFADWYTQLLIASNYPAAYWEQPALTKSALNQPAEFVLLQAPALVDKQPDRHSFASYFDPVANTATFPSIGKDALLIVPCPPNSSANYGHLLEFLRTAPATQIRALWSAVGKTVLTKASAQPLWLSTSGVGVQWLHIRLDSTPKYYQYEPYKRV